MKVKFKGWDCLVEIERYLNGRTCLYLVDAEFGEGVAYATVNVPDYPLEDDEVAIKNYAENEGMLDALISAGVVSCPQRTIQQGFVEIPICKLLL